MGIVFDDIYERSLSGKITKKDAIFIKSLKHYVRRYKDV